MDLSRSIKVFIILYTIVNTTTAAPIVEEDIMESNGQYGKYVEGDMLLTKDQQDALYDKAINTRNGVRDLAYRWPNRTVVYFIKEKNFDEDQLKVIKNAMADLMNKSCVKFRPREDDTEQAVIIQGTEAGCFSNLGFSPPGVQQVINLDKSCVKHVTVLHEMLHTLGFFHMHSTYNRDKYIMIIWDNIQQGQKHNFQKYGRDVVTDFGVEYDYNSVMHYAANAFSFYGKITITAKEKDVIVGPGDELTASDILKLNRMYC